MGAGCQRPEELAHLADLWPLLGTAQARPWTSPCCPAVRARGRPLTAGPGSICLHRAGRVSGRGPCGPCPWKVPVPGPSRAPGHAGSGRRGRAACPRRPHPAPAPRWTSGCSGTSWPRSCPACTPTSSSTGWTTPSSRSTGSWWCLWTAWSATSSSEYGTPSCTRGPRWVPAGAGRLAPVP